MKSGEWISNNRLWTCKCSFLPVNGVDDAECPICHDKRPPHPDPESPESGETAGDDTHNTAQHSRGSGQ